MAEIAALSGAKQNFRGGGIRASLKRVGVVKADNVIGKKRFGKFFKIQRRINVEDSDFPILLKSKLNYTSFKD